VILEDGGWKEKVTKYKTEGWSLDIVIIIFIPNSFAVLFPSPVPRSRIDTMPSLSYLNLLPTLLAGICHSLPEQRFAALL
jgi:hypothetical protein